MDRRLIKKFVKLFFSFCGILVISFFAYQYFSKPHLKLANNLTSSQVSKWQASTQPLIKSSDWKQKILNHYLQKGSKFKFFTVPGLRGAWSINPRTQKSVYATQWTPQGITITDKYYLISAYDGNHKYDSLIYVIDKTTGKYIKTLIIPSKAHLGGLGYDSKTGKVWVSNDQTGSGGQLSVLKEKTIDNYDAKTDQEPIKFDENYSLPWLKATSSVTVSQNCIFIPYFTANDNSAVVTIPLVDGKIDTKHLPSQKVSGDIMKEFEKTGADKYIYFSKAFSKMQGLAVYQEAAIFTSSYGNVDSTLTFANVKEDKDYSGGDWMKYKFNKLDSLSMMPYLEQVNIDESNKKLMMLFESGSSKYRMKTPYVMDRVLIVDINLKNLENMAKQ